MNRKTLIALIVITAVLMLGIAFGVFKLYWDPAAAPADKTPVSERFPLLGAVPSDAAAVFCFDGSGTARTLLKDSTGILSAVMAPQADKGFRDYMAAVSNAPVAVSLHNSGILIPLVVVKLTGRDPAYVMHLSAEAEAAGMKSLWLAEPGFLLASRSETLLNSSRRHFSEGISVLNSEGMAEVASSLAGGNAVFLCNHDAAKIAQTLLSRTSRKHSAFFSRFADWTGFALSVENGLVLTGTAAARDDAGYYLNVLRTVPGTARFPEMLPYYTASATAVVTGDISSYVAARKRYLDAQGKLDMFGKGTEQFAVQKGLREAAVAEFAMRDSMARALLLRCSKRLDSQKVIRDNTHAGAPAALFGSLFRLQDESACASLGEWMVIGSRKVVEAFVHGNLLDHTLKDWLQDGGVTAFEGRNLCAAVYYAPKEEPGRWEAMFIDPLLASLKGAMRGHENLPVLFTVTSERAQTELTFKVKEVSLNRMPAVEAGRETEVEVPSGPFPVRNCGTGKMNTFYQNASLSLCLNDENGKGLWGVPFHDPICGRVEEVDYYANGKIQFLFAAADKLYLIDRLGRFVNGFPVSLGREVLLGPDVYDFSGAHSYRVMVLHTDNTLEMYDLHGRKPQQWRGISAPETIRNLPQLAEYGGKKYWAVPASRQTLIYPFYGGESLPKKEAEAIAAANNL